MRRFLSVTLAVTLVGGWLIPSSAEAGPLARLFWRLRGSPTTVTTSVTTTAENNAGRRYSYEPGTVETVAPYTAPRVGAKPTWMLPKSNSGRYDAR